MSDLYAFRALRSARRAEPDDDTTMPTEWTEIDPMFATHVVRLAWAGDELLPLLRSTLETSGDPAAEARYLAAQYLASAKAVTLGTLRGGVDAEATLPAVGTDEAQPIPGQFGLAALDELDRWLVSRANRPASGELDEYLDDLVPRPDSAGPDNPPQPLDEPGTEPVPAIEQRSLLHALLGATWARLVDSLTAALLQPSEGELAQRCNRLLLVAGLIERRSFYGRPLTGDEIYVLLAKRIPVLPDPPFPAILPADQVKLVRKTAVSDLFVVRQEWRSYVADDVADIRNVLAGEASMARTTRIDESELTESSSTEQSSQTETSSESGSESTFSEEAKRALDLDIHAEGQVNVAASYGMVKLDASAGFSADFSLEDSTERATEISKKAVSRAASKVEVRTRADRTRRTLSRLESVQRHAINNETAAHVRGVYRWVKRVDRFQVWRYPDRMQLEFEIPEPGRFLLAQLRERPASRGVIAEPPAFVVPAEGITRDNYLNLATTYGATGLPEPPQATIGASAAVTLAPSAPPTLTGEQQNPPTMTKDVEIALTPGYAATGVTLAIDATPLRAIWRRENTVKAGIGGIEGFHTITASVAVGEQVLFEREVGPFEANTNTVQGTGSQVLVQYLEAHLHATVTKIFATPVTVKVPVAINLSGAGSGTVAISLSCTLTTQAEDAWKQDVYDALRSAYDLWLREWRAAQIQAGHGAEIAERSSDRHEEMIKAELRRHVIAWLLVESPFGGRPAVLTGADNAPDIDLDASLESAGTIQFLEQCFEWSNLAYVSYPYYWADRERWSDLMDLETADPRLGQFLRAGSARVVVPARPGFGAAVAHWLTYRQPWLGGGTPPVPGDPLFISVAKEIRDQTMPAADGEPGESWEVVLPTTLQWLDTSDALPDNDLARLGAPPHAPTIVLSRP